MPDDYWDRVEELFIDAVDRAEGDRRALLDARCGGNAALRAEVESLLAAHDRAPGRLRPVTVGKDHDEETVSGVAGTRVGPFTLIEQVGAGGMGTVYRATRTDSDFTQDVAIKLVPVSLREASALRRFKAERQILAELHHPHIVALIDGGVTADGLAWLAMEYVEGTPLTAYCRAHRLDLPRRLRLFQQVCSAVRFAHRHLVVHRDLKPANILVTDDGVPKVLDFGVAKLLAPERRPATETLTLLPGPLTPNYASPEQLRGLPVTTASDIYALGVLLYEVLTERRPYDITGRPLDAVLNEMLGQSPRRPSEAPADDASALPYDRRDLRGDLDAVVLKAMRANADERYGSADELSEDIGRFLTGRPVVARDPTLRYLASKMLVKYRVPAGVAASLLAAVVASLAIALWQWRAAGAERARAEANAAETRGIARALIFKVHDAVAPLPGSTPVREMLVAEALSYLDRLAVQARRDAGLQLEVARAYRQVADLQGHPGGTNLGNSEAAVASYAKALAVLRPLTSRANPDPEHLAEYAESAVRLGTTLQRMAGGVPRARDVNHDALRVAQRLLAARPRDEQARDMLASVHWNLATSVEPGAAEAHWLQARDLYASYLDSEPESMRWLASLVHTEAHIASFYEAQGSLAKEKVHLERTTELAARALAWLERQPAPSVSRETQSGIADLISVSGNAFLQLGETVQAIDRLHRSLGIRQQIAEADPKNVYARTRVADDHASLAWAYEVIGRGNDAVRHARLAVQTFDGLQGDEVIVQPTLGRVLLQLASSDWRAGNQREACAGLRRAAGIYDRLARESRLTAMDREHRAHGLKRLAACPVSPGPAPTRPAR